MLQVGARQAGGTMVGESSALVAAIAVSSLVLVNSGETGLTPIELRFVKMFLKSVRKQ